MLNDLLRWDRAKLTKALTTVALITMVLIALMPFIVAVYGLIAEGSWPAWTGFGDFTDPNGDFHRGKTLWDLMQLLIIPLILSLGAIWFNRQERKAERRIATDRQQEATLQNYLDKMAELMLREKLLDKKDKVDDPVVDVAQVRTVTTIRTLDASRRSILFQFLSDANLSDFLLVDASLNEADLQMTLFHKVNLNVARLFGTKFRGADLSEADLNGVYLQGVDLSEANLTGIYEVESLLKLATSLKGAWMPDGTIYDPGKHKFDWKEKIVTQQSISWLRPLSLNRITPMGC